MFLATLNDQQKLAFLNLADRLIRVDQHLAPQEEAMLAAMRVEMGLPDETPVPEMEVDAATRVFDTRPTRVAVMLELFGLGLADLELAPEEEALLDRIRAALGFDEAELLEQRDWVTRQMALVHEANAMMLEEA